MSWSKELHLIDMASQEGKSETTRLMYLKNALWRLLMIVFLGGACIFSSRLTIGTFWYWKGFEGMKRNQAVMAAEAFQKGAFYDRWSSAYPVAAGNLAIAIFRSSKKEYYLRQAEQHYLEATWREPYLYANYFILSDIYQRLADFEKQKYYDQKAKELSPFEYRQSVAKRNQTR